jgi:tetratricopeptide (TPR) repeat protein
LALTLWALCTLSPRGVSADAHDDEARALFEKGLEASDAQHWAEAADAFRRSLSLVERSSTRFNLVTALYRQGEYREALEAADVYLRNTDPSKDATKRGEIQRLADEMRATMGTLLIDVEPRNAQVRVDGMPAGENKPRHEIALNPGEHELILSADGYAPRIETVVVEKGVRTLVAIKLVPAAGAQAAPATGLTPAINAQLAEARRRNDLRMRILELDRQVSRLEESIQAANRRKPLILLSLGLGFALTGVVMASTSEDEGTIAGGVVVSVVGGVLLVSAGTSGLIRRSKRGYYQRRLDRFKQEREGLEVQLALSLTPGRGLAGVRLSF